MATHNNVIIIYYKYNMIIDIQSDAPYLTEEKLRSMILVKYLLGSIQTKQTQSISMAKYTPCVAYSDV